MARFASAGAAWLVAACGASAQLDVTHMWVNGVANPGAPGTNDSVAAVGVDHLGGVYSAVNFEDAAMPTGGIRYTDPFAGATQDVFFAPQNAASEAVTRDVLAIERAVPRDPFNCRSIPTNWAVVGGSYVGDVDFGPQLPDFGILRAGYAIQVSSAGAVLAGTVLEPLTANSRVEVTSIASGPPCIVCAAGGLTGGGAASAGAAGPGGPPVPPKSAPYECGHGLPWVAFGGYFTGEMNYDPLWFDPDDVTSQGGEDAFVSARSLSDSLPSLSAIQGDLELHLGSEGNERIIAIDTSEHSPRIAVTGHFDDGSLNFDPHSGGSPVNAISHAGDADLFVAVYDLVNTPLDLRYHLRWVYTIDNEGLDSGTGVAFDSVDNVYVTGYLGDPVTGNRDIWMARISETHSAPPSGLSAPTWEFVFGDDGDDAGLDVTVDHLDRPVFAGQFGKPFGEAVPQYCLDFDHTAGSAFVCSEGALDGFVARYYPNGTLDWAYAVGAAYDERVAGVDANRRYGGRLAYGGTFGAPSAPAGYQVDFNPHPSVANLLGTQGAGDGFVCASDPDLPTNVRSQVAIVLNDQLTLDADWAALVKAASDQLATPGVSPLDGGTYVTVLAAGSDEYGGASSGPLIPWTPLDAKTTPMLVQRLANTSKPAPSGSQFSLSDALTAAGEQIHFNGVAAGYRSILLVTEQPEAAGVASLQATRDNVVFTLAQADQINVLAAYNGSLSFPPSITRQYALENAVESVADVPNNPPLEDNLGFAAELVDHVGGFYLGYTDPQLGPILGRMFQRMSYCPGDYNLMNGVDPNDPNDFDAGSSSNVPYADWNFDGNWDGHIPFGLDLEKFNVDFNVGFMICP